MNTIDKGQRILMWIIIIGIFGLGILAAVETHASFANIVKGFAILGVASIQVWLTDSGVLGGGGTAGTKGKEPFWKLEYAIVVALLASVLGFAFLTGNL